MFSSKMFIVLCFIFWSMIYFEVLGWFLYVMWGCSLRYIFLQQDVLLFCYHHNLLNVIPSFWLDIEHQVARLTRMAHRNGGFVIPVMVIQWFFFFGLLLVLDCALGGWGFWNVNMNKENKNKITYAELLFQYTSELCGIMWTVYRLVKGTE